MRSKQIVLHKASAFKVLHLGKDIQENNMQGLKRIQVYFVVSGFSVLMFFSFIFVTFILFALIEIDKLKTRI